MSRFLKDQGFWAQEHIIYTPLKTVFQTVFHYLM